MNCLTDRLTDLVMSYHVLINLPFVIYSLSCSWLQTFPLNSTPPPTRPPSPPHTCTLPRLNCFLRRHQGYTFAAPTPPLSSLVVQAILSSLLSLSPSLSLSPFPSLSHYRPPIISRTHYLVLTSVVLLSLSPSLFFVLSLSPFLSLSLPFSL